VARFLLLEGLQNKHGLDSLREKKAIRWGITSTLTWYQASLEAGTQTVAKLQSTTCDGSLR
jgi:hypothetical protein